MNDENVVKTESERVDQPNLPVSKNEEQGCGQVSIRGAALLQKREELIRQHIENNGSLAKLMKDGVLSTEDAMNYVVIELTKEAESLKGSELLFAYEGNLRDATTVQIKRVEALEKTAKAIQRKHQMVSDEVINLDSPYIRLIITWTLNMMKETLDDIKLDAEMVDIFLKKLAIKTENWKRDLKREIMMFNQQNIDEEDDETEEKS